MPLAFDLSDSCRLLTPQYPPQFDLLEPVRHCGEIKAKVLIIKPLPSNTCKNAKIG